MAGSPLSIAVVLAVFVLTYVGMAAGRVPGLKIDRTGIALLAVAALLAPGLIDPAAAVAAVDLSTLVLMFGLMILSAQYAEAGLYAAASARIAAATANPHRLLALTVMVAGGLSAVLVNDVVVFAMTPMLCQGLAARRLDPRPYLMALAGAGNAGSAATLIGNPQNILIGQVGDLDFWSFAAVCGPPAVAALVCVYVAVAVMWRRELVAAAASAAPPPLPDRGAAAKAIGATVLLLALFAAPIPREIAALAVAAVLLLSRTVASRHLVAAVDWHLLLLIACLFVVTGALAATGIAAGAIETAAAAGWSPEHPGALAAGALIVSNTIGNVPATVLILALWPDLGAKTLYGLALLSTLAGNLLIVGSLCNLIVAERAHAAGIRLGFGDFARAGLPMTLASMALAMGWLAIV